jgi:protoporphyrinogen IX oxidase
MQQVLSMTYLWLKAGHIIFVIFWMAGLFMLPRFFVYHQECAPDSPENAAWIDRWSWSGCWACCWR